jgi:hypothetical protein
MNRSEFETIFDNQDKIDWDGDNAFQGLVIIAKYLPKSGLICGAGHDVIFSVGVDELIESGITSEDANKLRSLNWMIDDDYMSCFV